MDLLQVFDDHSYQTEWDRFPREAVRALIIKNKKIALLQSRKDRFFKFPGGGIKNNENHLEALIRETKEETGFRIIPESVSELGMIRDISKSFNENRIFDEKSYYYYADILNMMIDKTPVEYDDCYKDSEFQVMWIDTQRAYQINAELADSIIGYKKKILVRETFILDYLIHH